MWTKTSLTIAHIQHCLLSEGSSAEFQQTVQTIQTEIQDSYELSLAQYVTHRVRYNNSLLSVSEKQISRSFIN